MSCLAAAGFSMGLLITDDIPFWFQVLYVIVFWALTGTGYTLLGRLTFDNGYKEGYNDGWEAQKINGEIFKEINAGEKNEFEIEMPNCVMHEYVILMGRNNKLTSDDDKNKYVITCIDNLGDTSKVTFTKIKENKGE